MSENKKQPYGIPESSRPPTDEEIITEYLSLKADDNYTRNVLMGSFLQNHVARALLSEWWVKSVSYTGVEYKYPELLTYLRYMDDKEALDMRFAPDLKAVIELSDKSLHFLYIEVKASDYIEKNAYIHYLTKAPSHEFILVSGTANLRCPEPLANIKAWNFIEELTLIDGHDIVAKAQEQGNEPWDVDDEGWVTPPKFMKRGPYREFNEDALRFWDGSYKLRGSLEEHFINKGGVLIPPPPPKKGKQSGVTKDESPIY